MTDPGVRFVMWVGAIILILFSGALPFMFWGAFMAFLLWDTRPEKPEFW